MGSRLELLPIELIEQIVSYLDPLVIACLRLTSRAIEAKASHGRFREILKRRAVQLKAEPLRELPELIGLSSLIRGCMLENYILTGIVRLGKAPEPAANAKLAHLLAESFRSLKGGSRNAALASLRLCLLAQFGRRNGGPFRYRARFWDGAQRTLEIVFAALAESHTPVSDHLDLFGAVQGCSLVFEHFLASIIKFAPTHIFGSLKRLTVRLAGPDVDEAFPEDVTSPIEYSEVNCLRDILRALCAMPALESLDLHWYTNNTSHSTSSAPFVPPEELAAGVALPHLKHCRLRGFYTSESDLLGFLQAVRPADVSLVFIHLLHGTYASVFEYLANQDSPVTRYNLEDLKEGPIIVHYEVPGSPRFRYRDPSVGPSTLTREADDAKKPIGYRSNPGRALGSAACDLWWESMSREFGPPYGDEFYSFEAPDAEMNPWATT